MKNHTCFIALILALFLGACGGENKPTGPPAFESQHEPNALAGLNEVANTTKFSDIWGIEGQKVTNENIVEKKQFIRIQGWAIDPVAEKTVSKVYIAVNGKYYATEYGAERPKLAEAMKKPEYLKSGYVGRLPLAAFDQDANVVTIIVISADGTSFFKGKEVTVRLK